METDLILMVHLELSLVRYATAIDTYESFTRYWIIHHIRIQLLLTHIRRSLLIYTLMQ